MKVIIPVAGIGSRLRPHTHTQPKSLVPVAGKPLLSHIIDSLVEAGLNDFVFVIGHLGDKIIEHIKSKYPNINYKTVNQEPREGIGHAIWLCKDYVNPDEPCMIVLGDTIIDADLEYIINSEQNIVAVKKVDNPANFGLVSLHEDGSVESLIEKPKIPKSNLALVGMYKFVDTGALMEALGNNIHENKRTHNEFHLTDGIQRMLEEGHKIYPALVENWYDCGSRESLLDANAIMLKRNQSTNRDECKSSNCIINPPVNLAPGCVINNSIIGPNVSIGENTIVKSSVISNTIIGAFSQIENAVLIDSLIGSDSALKGLSQSLNIGDSTEIHFS